MGPTRGRLLANVKDELLRLHQACFICQVVSDSQNISSQAKVRDQRTVPHIFVLVGLKGHLTSQTSSSGTKENVGLSPKGSEVESFASKRKLRALPSNLRNVFFLPQHTQPHSPRIPPCSISTDGSHCMHQSRLQPSHFAPKLLCADTETACCVLDTSNDFPSCWSVHRDVLSSSTFSLTLPLYPFSLWSKSPSIHPPLKLVSAWLHLPDSPHLVPTQRD